MTVIACTLAKATEADFNRNGNGAVKGCLVSIIGTIGLGLGVAVSLFAYAIASGIQSNELSEQGNISLFLKRNSWKVIVPSSIISIAKSQMSIISISTEQVNMLVLNLARHTAENEIFRNFSPILRTKQTFYY